MELNNVNNEIKIRCCHLILTPLATRCVHGKMLGCSPEQYFQLLYANTAQTIEKNLLSTGELSPTYLQDFVVVIFLEKKTASRGSRTLA